MISRSRILRLASSAASLCAISSFAQVPSAVADSSGRPIVIVFAVKSDSGSDIEVSKEASGGLSSEQRTMAAARGVRECLNDSGAVSAILYNADSAMFVRAETEAKIHLERPSLPTEEEREAIGKAFDAIYVVAVSARPAVDSPSILELVMDGNDVKSKQAFSDKTRMTAVSQAPAPDADGNAIHRLSTNPQFDNIVLSAANTLTVHLLKGPLAEYFGPVPPPSLQPKQVAPTPIGNVVTPVAQPQAEIHTSALNNPAPDKSAAPTLPATLPNVATPAPIAPATSVTPSPGVQQTSEGLPQGRVHVTRVEIPPPGGLPAAPKVKRTPGAEQPENAPLPDLHGVDAYHQAIALGSNPGEASKAANQQATQLLASGDGNASISLLRKAIDQDPLSASLRLKLAQAYMSVHRSNDAANEAKRALTLVPDMTAADEIPLAGIFAQSFADTGNTTAARATYNEILATPSTHTVWARVALADLDAAEGKTTEAEAQYRAILEANRNETAAAIGLARLMTAAGDYTGAVKALKLAGNDSSPESAAAHVAATASLFDEGILKIATLIVQNRKAWDSSSLSREVIFNATTAQTARIDGLVSILKAMPPPASSTMATKNYRRRIQAAAELTQASSDLLNFLQTGDTDSGDQSNLELDECQKDIAEAQRQ